MVTPGQPVSFFVDDLAEGGGPPIQQNLRIQGATFVPFNYNGRSPTVTALKIDFMTDAGNILTQHYSCGDPGRVGHTPDGKMLTGAPTRNSNLGILMAAMSNCGFPQERLQAGDITAIVGLYAYWDGHTEERAGLLRPDGTPAPANVVAVPTQIHQLPGGQPGVAAPAAPAMPGTNGAAPAAPQPQAAPAMGIAQQPPASPGAPSPNAPAQATAAPTPAAPAPAPAAVPEPAPQPAPAGGVDVQTALVELLNQMGPTFTRQHLMMASFEAHQANPPLREAMGAYLFTPECEAALVGFGYTVNGNDVQFNG